MRVTATSVQIFLFVLDVLEEGRSSSPSATQHYSAHLDFHGHRLDPSMCETFLHFFPLRLSQSCSLSLLPSSSSPNKQRNNSSGGGLQSKPSRNGPLFRVVVSSEATSAKPKPKPSEGALKGIEWQQIDRGVHDQRRVPPLSLSPATFSRVIPFDEFSTPILLR
jgi:hypothetical protein